jgi:quercetin dioxygenase-like cupin family protein
MAIYELDRLETRELIPGFTGKFIHTEKMTVAFWEIREGSDLPVHAHPHEQVTIVQEGKLALTMSDESRVLEKGMVMTIPSNAVHSGKALTKCRVLDIFCPVREDYK